MKNYLIAGGGKCGSHFVNKYLSTFTGDDFHIHLDEIKNLDKVNELLKFNKNLILQKSFTSIEDVEKIIPFFIDKNFEILLVERFPVQQYLAWYYTLVSNFIMFPKNNYVVNRTKNHFLDWCFKHIEASLELRNYAWKRIQIESFTNNFQERADLVYKITNKKISEEDESTNNFSVSKSNFGISDKIISIKYDRYPNILSNFEIDILNNIFSTSEFPIEYLKQYKVLTPTDTKSDLFWNKRVIFYHNIFYKKNELNNYSIRSLYLFLFKNKKIFKLFFYKKFINGNQEYNLKNHE